MSQHFRFLTNFLCTALVPFQQFSRWIASKASLRRLLLLIPIASLTFAFLWSWCQLPNLSLTGLLGFACFLFTACAYRPRNRQPAMAYEQGNLRNIRFFGRRGPQSLSTGRLFVIRICLSCRLLNSFVGVHLWSRRCFAVVYYDRLVVCHLATVSMGRTMYAGLLLRFYSICAFSISMRLLQMATGAC